jgi:hypothetical protein
MHYRSFLLVLPLLCSACGCQNTGAPQAIAKPARIIIGFDETVNSPDSELSARLGKELGCELEPLQALGGHAFVYTCLTADAEEALVQKLNRLGQHKGVRYAEMDRIRKIQD